MVSFVILNYNNAQDTIVCVNSIHNSCAGQDYSVVIVDNGSECNCVENLNKQFSDDDKVTLIFNNANIGFAAGNNVGCKYATEYFNPDFLYVINNDTRIDDCETINKIYSIYNEKNYDILGPKIFDSVLNKDLNPSTSQANLKEVKAHYKRLKFANSMLMFGSFAYRATYVGYGKIFRKCNYSAFGLCGAALIFSRKYWERFNDVFVERTFFYCEEHYLQYRVQKYNLKMIYDDRICIEHLGSKTTDKLYKNSKSKIKFKSNAKMAGTKGLIEAYEKDLEL